MWEFFLALAKEAARYELTTIAGLVNLLGLHIYERVRERAVQRQRDAEKQAEAIQRVLDETSGVDDSTLDAAKARATTRRSRRGSASGPEARCPGR